MKLSLIQINIRYALKRESKTPPDHDCAPIFGATRGRVISQSLIVSRLGHVDGQEEYRGAAGRSHRQGVVVFGN